ncbi:hypothetical protein AB9F35_00070 [Rhizobium leguminosarum]|uniref:hypothetical protein n=1 Tax=Rhizobium leguminosarum TaxID=384 RepID=UPI003F9483DD
MFLSLMKAPNSKVVKSIGKIAALSILLGSVPLAAEAGCASTTSPRNFVEMFSYSLPNSPDDTQKFNVFLVDVLRDRIRQSMFELRSGHSELDYLSKLEVQPANISDMTTYKFNPSDEMSYWDKSNALALMYGTLLPETGKNILNIRSTIVSGAFQKYLPTQSLRATVKGNIDTVEEINDSHLLIYIYLLARDAEERNCDKTTVIHLYAKARRLTIDLDRAGYSDLTLQQLKQSISERLAVLGAP